MTQTVHLVGPRDDVTHAIESIDYAHHEIHSGSHFFIEGYATLDSGDDLYVKLVTPDTAKWAHFVWEISSSAILTTELYEDASGGMTGGATVTPLNNNRNSSKSSVLTITSGVTAPTDTGTTISQSKWGSRRAGGTISREDELILKQNTTYCRKFLSGTNGNIVCFKAHWYEHTNKE